MKTLTMTLRRSACGLAAAALLGLSGCGQRYTYPNPRYGWVSPDRSVVFGLLEPSGVRPGEMKILFGKHAASNPSAGEFLIQPTALMRGYSAGDQVEITGHPLKKAGEPAAAPAEYHVTGISLWVNIGRPTYLSR